MRGKKEIQENQILQLIAEGMANKEIAAELGKSKKTIDDKVHKLLRKHHCKNRTELAIMFLRVA